MFRSKIRWDDCPFLNEAFSWNRGLDREDLDPDGCELEDVSCEPLHCLMRIDYRLAWRETQFKHWSQLTWLVNVVS